MAFASVGDRVTVSLARRTSLTVIGPFAAEVPRDDGNLASRAARLAFPDITAAIELEKTLPTASGIGGGSADAAATIRALTRLTGGPVPSIDLLRLGADVPVCLSSRATRMRGIGEILEPAALPPCPVLLVNPRVAVATPAVFAGLTSRDGVPMPERLPRWRDAADLAAWLRGQRNDLEPPALGIAPVIARVLALLAAQPGASIARMSGSGATCFALFEHREACEAGAAALKRSEPNWWVAAAALT